MFWAPIYSGMKILLGTALSSVLNKGKSAITSLFNIKKNLWPLFMDGVQLSQDYSHFEEAVYFLPFSSQNKKNYLKEIGFRSYSHMRILTKSGIML